MKKRLICVLLTLLMAISFSQAMAEAPAPQTLTATYESIRGNASFTPDSYPNVWITPYFSEHIIKGLEKYPPHFLTFAAPEGTSPVSFTYDESVFLDHDKLMMYYYFAYDRYSFEVFLEKAEEENIIADGSDGVAMFVIPDSRRARALIDLKPYFSNTPKLEIILDDCSRDITAAQLKEMIEAEVSRVTSTMALVELDRFWSEKAYSSVELHGSSDPVTLTVNTSDMTVTKLKESELETMTFNGTDIVKTSIKLDSYSYVTSNEEEASDITLTDGSTWRMFTNTHSGYAYHTVIENGKYDRPVLLTVQITGDPENFAEHLEALSSVMNIEIAE